MGFQCYFGVLVTTKLIPYYKAVSSIELFRLHWEAGRCRENGPGLTLPYGDHIQENAPSTLDFLMNVYAYV